MKPAAPVTKTAGASPDLAITLGPMMHKNTSSERDITTVARSEFSLLFFLQDSEGTSCVCVCVSLDTLRV